MLTLTLSFLYVGLLSFGGGLSALSLMHRELVERLGWLTEETMVDMIAIAEMTPGPLAVDTAAFVGMRLYGIAGAVLATCACVLPGCLMACGLARLNARLGSSPRWRGATGALRAAATGLILSGAVTVVRGVLLAGGGVDLLAAACFCAALYLSHCRRGDPVLCILGVGVLGGLLKYGLS